MSQLFNCGTKKICKEVINTKSEAYKKYKSDSEAKFSIIKLLIGMNMFLDPLVMVLGEISKKFLLGIILLIITTIYYVGSHYKNKNLFANNANWQEMAKSNIVPEKKLLCDQVNKQLEKNKKAVRITLKCLGYIFSIIFISSCEDYMKMFFISTFNVENSFGWYILIFILCMVELILLLPLSSVIGCIYFIIRYIVISLKKMLNYWIDNGLFVKDYILLYATQKVLEESNINLE